LGQIDVTKVLLSRKALVSAKNNDGNTPLHLAAIGGFADVARLLVAEKADINARNRIDYTPANEAAQNGHTEMVGLLRRRGGS
jgi:ankyrin repeat protein